VYTELLLSKCYQGAVISGTILRLATPLYNEKAGSFFLLFDE
jgi:hypothetical protein